MEQSPFGFLAKMKVEIGPRPVQNEGVWISSLSDFLCQAVYLEIAIIYYNRKQTKKDIQKYYTYTIKQIL